MDEIAATWPESWQEIYERVLKGGETIVSIARERGVTEGAVRKTLNKIRTRLAENKELQKFIRYFD
jgi:transposase-like protein